MIKKKENNTTIILSTERKTLRMKMISFFFYSIALFLVAVIFLPLVWMLLSAFKTTKEFYAVPPSLFPDSFEISKAIDIWNKANFFHAYINTFIVVIGCVFVCLLSCGLGGYVLSRLKPTGSRVLQVVIFWTMLIPQNLGMVTLYIKIVDLGLMNSYIPLWLMAGTSSYYTILFKSFFDGISSSYLDAARIDGAGEVTIFTKIILPLSKPIFMTITIFTVNNKWGEFLWPYLLIRDQAKHTLGIRSYVMKSVLTPDEYMLMLIFVVIPPIIVFCFLQNQIMEGVNVGGIKM